MLLARRLLVAALSLVSSAALADPVPGQPAGEPLVDWIEGSQWTAPGPATGAVALDGGTAFYADDVAYQRVVPYFANLAVTAALDAAPSARTLALAERWIDWSLAHLGPDGVPTEWWVSTDGSLATACPATMTTSPAVDRCDYVDATDSGAATLLDVARAYAEAGGDSGRLSGWARLLRRVGRTLEALQDVDGLTWARADFPVKYLMDNAETVRGFRALAAIERATGRPAAGVQADNRAHEAAAGLASMRDAATGLWAWARHGDGTDEVTDMNRWYADAMAQAWPVLFDAAPSAEGTAGYAAVNGAYDGSLRPDWATTPDPGGFERSSVAVAAMLSGDQARAEAHVASVWDRRVAPPGGGTFVAPFTVADAGWLLRAVVATQAAAPPVAARSAAPSGLRVSAPNPSPTVDRTTVTVAVDTDADVTVEVFDVRGRRVRMAFQGRVEAVAPRRVRVDTAGWTSGVYVVRVVAGRAVGSQRVVVVR